MLKGRNHVIFGGEFLARTFFLETLEPGKGGEAGSAATGKSCKSGPRGLNHRSGVLKVFSTGIKPDKPLDCPFFSIQSC